MGCRLLDTIHAYWEECVVNGLAQQFGNDPNKLPKTDASKLLVEQNLPYLNARGIACAEALDSLDGRVLYLLYRMLQTDTWSQIDPTWAQDKITFENWDEALALDFATW